MKKQTVMMAVICLVSMSAIAAGGAHGDHHEIPWSTIKIQAINLGILLAILIYFIRTPLKNSFKARQQSFVEESQKTALALKQAEEELSDIKNKIKTLEDTETASINNAQKEAATAAAKIISDSQAQGKKIIDDTQLIISAEVAKAKNQIREKIINKSMSAAEQSIKSSSDSITKKSEAGFLQDLGQVKA